MLHELAGGRFGNAGLRYRLYHAFQPEVAHLRPDRNVLVDLAQPRMTVPLHIVLGTAEKTGEIVELLDTGMGDTMAATMEEVQFLRILVLFDDVVKGLDETIQAIIAADGFVE